MSDAAIAWVLQDGPRKDDVDQTGKPYGARCRALRSVLLVLAVALDDERVDACVGLDTIAERALYSQAQARRLVRQLVADGWIEITERGGGRGQATIYRLLSDRRERVSSEAKGSHPEPEAKGSHPERKGVMATSERVSSTCDPLVSSLFLPEVSTSLEEQQPRDATLSRFDEFWTVYPRHEGKQAAVRAFEKATRSVTVETIVEGAQRYRDDPNRVAQFTKHPTTWLNQGCWDDDPLPARASAPPPRRHDGRWTGGSTSGQVKL